MGNSQCEKTVQKMAYLLHNTNRLHVASVDGFQSRGKTAMLVHKTIGRP